MTKVLGIRIPYSITIRKKFGKSVFAEDGGEFGVSVFGYGTFGAGEVLPESIYHGYYQMRQCREGYIPVQVKFFRPANPRTVPQQQQRSKMVLAVAEWQNLTAEQKKEYNKRAIGQNLTGYNLFISEYLRSL